MNQGVFGFPGPAQTRVAASREIWVLPVGKGEGFHGTGNPTLNRAIFTFFILPVGTRVTGVAIRFNSGVANSTYRWAVYSSNGFIPVDRTHPGGVFADIGGTGTVVQQVRFDTPTELFFLAGVGQVASPSIYRHAQNTATSPYGINHLSATNPQINANFGGLYLSASVTGELPARVALSDLAGVDNTFTPIFGLQLEMP